MLEKLKQIFKLNKENELNNSSIEDRIEDAFNSLEADIVRIEVGSDIVEHINSVLEKINDLREDIKTKSGFIFPLVRVLEKDFLQENELVFYVREKETVHEFVIPNEENICDFVYKTLDKIFQEHIDDIFTMEYAEKYITKVQMTNSWLVWDISKQLGAYEIKTVLTNIIKNKKSIRDIHYIFEKIDECLAENRDCFHVWKPEAVSKRVCKEI